MTTEATRPSPYYIAASSPPADERDRVLKQGHTFAVFDRYGDVKPIGLAEEGLYHEGTRYLSLYLMELGSGRPMLLSSSINRDNTLLSVDLANADLQDEQGRPLPRGVIHLLRSKFLWEGACYERIRVHNYGSDPAEIVLTLHFGADFADIFEVRGTNRQARGETLPPETNGNEVLLGYRGLDDVVRRTRIRCSPEPMELTDSLARFKLSIAPAQDSTIDITVECEAAAAAEQQDDEKHAEARPGYVQALTRTRSLVDSMRRDFCEVTTSNERFNEWLRRSTADVEMMITETEAGPYPFAGVPWFSTAFGRDGIITAMEALWVCPNLARGVLNYLARYQATEEIPEQDAEPGKILHETRRGEMAALGEIPFGLYYGSIDSTPLFVMLAGDYFAHTGDRETVERLWPNLERALEWIERYGDLDGDGFVEYARRSATGLLQQGWKDSNDSVFHADGALAEAPIALCEVQGYVYAAYRAAAQIAAVLGRGNRAAELTARAERLKAQFEQAFWLEDLGTYALALDGQKRPCRVRSSNAGHVLFAGLATAQHAARVANNLLDEAGFSGWGVRTIATTEARYNPMSYHNGSVWPHDNAMVAAGLARYGHHREALQIFAGLFDASLHVDLHRMPELFCGFQRRVDEGPTLYPVACAPQAWAAAAVFLLLGSCLGLRVEAEPPTVTCRYAVLPESLRWVRVNGLRVGGETIDLRFERHEHDVGVNVLRRTGSVRVTVMK